MKYIEREIGIRDALNRKFSLFIGFFGGGDRTGIEMKREEEVWMRRGERIIEGPIWWQIMNDECWWCMMHDSSPRRTYQNYVPFYEIEENRPSWQVGEDWFYRPTNLWKGGVRGLSSLKSDLCLYLSSSLARATFMRSALDSRLFDQARSRIGSFWKRKSTIKSHYNSYYVRTSCWFISQVIVSSSPSSSLAQAFEQLGSVKFPNVIISR